MYKYWQKLQISGEETRISSTAIPAPHVRRMHVYSLFVRILSGLSILQRSPSRRHSMLMFLVQFDFAINFPIINHSVFIILTPDYIVCIGVAILHRYSVQWLFRPEKKKTGKETSANCLQSARLRRLATTAVFQGKNRVLVLTFIHISFLCWKQIEGKSNLLRSSQFPFTSKCQPGPINGRSKRRVFFL